jgi:hypothetical protein
MAPDFEVIFKVFSGTYTRMDSKGENLARRCPEFEPDVVGVEADQLE